VPVGDLVMVDGAAVVYRAGEVHVLSPTATLLWQSCDGDTTLGALSADFARAFAVAPDVVLGDVTDSSQGAASTESYTLELQLQALNVAANVANTTRTNRGRLTYTASNGVVNTLNGGVVNALVVAPSVQMTKVVAPATGVGGGDTVTYTLTITNPVATGSAPAFNWNFSDTLPSDLQTPLLVSVVAPGGVTTTAAFTGNVLNGTISQLNAGQSVVVTYKAQIKPATPIGKTIINAASSQTTTLPGPCGTSGNVSAPCSPSWPRPGPTLRRARACALWRRRRSKAPRCASPN